MSLFRFRDRASVLDDRSRRFLTTVAWLGGYVTPEQAQLLGVRNSVPRVHVQLKDLEDWGFLKRVGVYPSIYQVTKSVTRLMGTDLSARREHTNETIRTRLLTVNFYLEAIRWPVEFVFDHQQKISRLTKLGCETALFPQRGQRSRRPYLWEDILLQRPSGELVLTMVDHLDRVSSYQLNSFLKKFAPNLGLTKLRLMAAVGCERRERLFRQQLSHPRLQRLLDEQGITMPLREMLTIYRVQRAVPVVRPLITNSQRLRELRALNLASRDQSALQRPRHVIQKNPTHTNNGISAERGDMS
jgi:DNA-binding Lrp family transcriptional regulator